MERGRWFSAFIFLSLCLCVSTQTTVKSTTCRPTPVILRNPSRQSSFIGTNWDEDPLNGSDDIYVDLYVRSSSRTFSSSTKTYSTCAEQEADAVFLLAEYFMSRVPGSAVSDNCGSEVYVIGCANVFDTAATFSQELNITTLFMLDNHTRLLKPLRHLVILFLRTYGLVTIAAICRENEPDYFVASLCYEMTKDVNIMDRTVTADFFNLPSANSTPNTSSNTGTTLDTDDRVQICAKILNQALRSSNVLLFLLAPSDVEICLKAAASLGITTNQYVIISLNASNEKSNVSWDHISVSSPVFILNPESDIQGLPGPEDFAYVSTRNTVSNFLFEKRTTGELTLSTDEIFNDTTLMFAGSPTIQPFNKNKPNFNSTQAGIDLDRHGTSMAVYLPDGSTQLFAIVDPTQNETLLLLVTQENMDAMWSGKGFPPAFSVLQTNATSTAVSVDYSFLAPVVVLVILLAVGVAYLTYDRKLLTEGNLVQDQENSSFVDDDLTKWQIRSDELKELPSHSKSHRSRSQVSMTQSTNSTTKTSRSMALVTHAEEVELYYGRKVWVKRRELAYFFVPESHHIQSLQKLKRLHHSNFTHLFGVVLSGDPSVYEMRMVMEYCPKQSIYDLITQENFDFTFALKAILIRDIVSAMTFLHGSFLNCHGSLKSPNCLVSDRFTVKITDYALHIFPIYPPAITQDESLYHMLLWTAPEILRGPIIRIRKGSKEGDVYSFAIIIQEILTLTEPFYHPNSFLTPKDIVKKLIDKSTLAFRPPVPYDVIPPQLRALITSSWDEEPTERPTFKVIGQRLNKMTDELPKNTSYLTYVIQKMEDYSFQLEYRVAKATDGLMEEKKKSDELLAQMMPKTVLDRLRVGQIVQPEAFQQVTIGFTAVIDFGQFAVHSTPIEIVLFLNGLYTVFDDIIEHFDIYKVETIQDSYMVASGLPTRNEHNHVREVGSMALQMLRAVEKVRMPAGGAANMKIGLHTGGCAAGVIGVKAPRYCLFGDTINTASRMCTVGEAHKVVISSNTKTYLDQHFPDEFKVDFRADTEVKGKGKMKTYYLLEKPGQ